MEKLTGSDTSAIVELAKKLCRIDEIKTDEQIADICKLIASFAPDTKFNGSKTEYGEIGISIMLSIALYEFPEFYQKYELWQRN